MVAKAKCIKGCHILAEMNTLLQYCNKFTVMQIKLVVVVVVTTQLNQQSDWKPRKNVAITGNSIVLAYPWGTRKGYNFALGIWKGTILIRISIILKGEDLDLRAEPPRTKLYWVPPPPPRGASSCVEVSNTDASRGNVWYDKLERWQREVVFNCFDIQKGANDYRLGGVLPNIFCMKPTSHPSFPYDYCAVLYIFRRTSAPEGRSGQDFNSVKQ